MSRHPSGPKDGNYEQYIEHLMQESAQKSQTSQPKSKTMLPSQSPIAPSPYSSDSKTTTKPSRQVYVFIWKKQILNMILIWLILGTMCLLILPPAELFQGLITVFILGLLVLGSNFSRRNKPLPTAKETTSLAGRSFLKRIILMFLNK